MDDKNTKERMDRRIFLRSAAATGAGLAFSPIAFGQTDSGKKSDDINVALLGAGARGRVLVNGCLKITGVRFKAVCDIWETFNQKRISRILGKYGHEHHTYVDYKEMLDKEKDLDAVIIATPDFWHAKQTVDCLDAGLHVYCETAMSNTIEGARKMAMTAERTGKLLQIGHQRRSNPFYIHCFEHLIKETKLLGRITAINGQWNRWAHEPLGWPRHDPIDQATLEKYGYTSMEQFRNWRWYKGLGGGPIVDLGSHQIDIYNWFLQANPRSVIASGRMNVYDPQKHEWPDTVMVVYEYESAQGPTSAFYQIISGNRDGGYFEKFLGEQGIMVISEASFRNAIHPEFIKMDAENWFKCFKKGHLTISEKIMQQMENLTAANFAKLFYVDESMPLPFDFMPPVRIERPSLRIPVKLDKPYHQPHLENFLDAIRGKMKLNCPAEIGYETAVTVLKINEAVEAGRKLSFEPDEFVVYNPHKKRTEHITGTKLPNSVRNCRYHSLAQRRRGLQF
ncbi:MAG: Gfo/Idh/MocA family oxidoreductase [Sedimentisphaerales bacterium]|nr:Gfo/Idh/MocA family oxidoreductase [Sedimentisphaerales bacterium]